MMDERDIRFRIASEHELAQLMAGEPTLLAYGQSDIDIQRIPPKTTGVFTLERPDGSPTRPVILLVRDDDQKRLFVRFSQNRSDLSPISPWCHVVPTSLIECVDNPSVYPNHGGFTAAWCGLIIAEASVMMDRPVSRLTLNPCMGTQSYAVARCAGLWGFRRYGDVIGRYDLARRTFGSVTSKVAPLRASFEGIWAALHSASAGIAISSDRTARSIAEALAIISSSEGIQSSKSAAIGTALDPILPADLNFKTIDESSSKDRLELFDSLIIKLRGFRKERESAAYAGSAFVCGYLANVMAGGSASFTVAEAASQEFPEVLAWAYVIGSLGERVTWTASFDGLGRLIARELERPFHFLEQPTADISLEEAVALIDPGLKDRYVHLRLKGGRVAKVSLMPGVESTFSLDLPQEAARDSKADQSRTASVPDRVQSEQGRADLFATTLVDMLLPKILERLDQQGRDDRGSRSGRSATKPAQGKSGRGSSVGTRGS